MVNHPDGEAMAEPSGWEADDDWRVLRNGARVHRTAVVAEWVRLSPGVVVHPFALVGHLASQAKVLRHPGEAIRCLIVGENTEIGPHTTIYGGADIGPDCLIGDGASIREHVIIGSRCIVGRNVCMNFKAWLGDDVRIMDGSFVAEWCEINHRTLLGAGVVTSGDRRPGPTYTGSNPPIIGKDCLIGSGANLLPGVTIGDGATVGAGALVVRDVRPGATMMGAAARASAQTVINDWAEQMRV